MEKQRQKCHRCKYSWKYKGKKLKLKVPYPQFIQCPNCLTSTKLIVKKKIAKKEVELNDRTTSTRTN